MAGIAGIKQGKGSLDIVKKMLEKIRHRGRDSIEVHGGKKWNAGVCASKLSHFRGNGFAAEGDVAVLFDGEIYNKRQGDQSDADVVMDLFKQHGRIFPRFLEGVFACAVISGDELLLARDAVGVRPVYFGETDDGSLCFASEMKALTQLAHNVNELLPATTLSSDFGVAGYVPKLPDVIIPDNPEKAAELLQEILMNAVKKRLEDGAVGACLLSGGLDSSIIAAAVKKLGADMPVLTVGMEGAPDLENARIVAEHLGMEHEMILFGAEDIEKLVERAVTTMESFDEDCVSGTISNLFASGAASEITNCILSGEGGDELFGGYHLLKDVPTESGRLMMMKRLMAVAYNTAVQRLDRSMMGNSINYRTPFIDTQVIAFAEHVPVDWKIHALKDGTLIEKWLLREAFREMLPETIYKRRKLRFAGGTGTDDIMDKIASAHVNGKEFTSDTRNTPGGYILNSPKELWYYKIFKKEFPEPSFENLVGRWDPDK